MDELRVIAGRLAAGSVGRTEAGIQSEVRKFLLDADLDLDGGDLHDVLLEVQAGGDRRIDVEAGIAAIEVKKVLGLTEGRRGRSRTARRVRSSAHRGERAAVLGSG